MIGERSNVLFLFSAALVLIFSPDLALLLRGLRQDEVKPLRFTKRTFREERSASISAVPFSDSEPHVPVDPCTPTYAASAAAGRERGIRSNCPPIFDPAGLRITGPGLRQQQLRAELWRFRRPLLDSKPEPSGWDRHKAGCQTSAGAPEQQHNPHFHLAPR